MPNAVTVESPTKVDDELLQRVRLAHCCYEGKEPHQCIGSVLISQHGVALLCNLCGSDKPTVCVLRTCHHEDDLRVKSDWRI
jgi:hypothetical protein